jgi:uncharacterized membrane protein YphA (DoxX/SURF4 family)
MTMPKTIQFVPVSIMVVTAPAVRWIALLGLCAAYLQGGLDKLIDFPGAISETRHFGLEPALPFTVATIITELAGSFLVLSGRLRWVGAAWLAGFTLIATLIANRFWALPMPDRFASENSFFEHLGLAGGFVLVAWQDLREATGMLGEAGGTEARANKQAAS